MHERRYRSGEAVFRAGDPSDTVFLVRAGSVELEETGEIVAAGEVFGRAGVLTGGARPHSARAVEEVVLLALERAEALGRIEADEATFRALFGALEGELDEPVPAAGAPEPGPTAPFRIRIAPASELAAETVGADAHDVCQLPYVVGRGEDGEAPGGMRQPDLALCNQPPYWLSRWHFAIERHADEMVIRDCGSFHGTIVNGRRIGAGSDRSIAPLEGGTNEVIAGNDRSPYRFAVTLERDGEA